MHPSLLKLHDGKKTPRRAKCQGTATVVFCHRSPVLPLSSSPYLQRCFERDSRDSEIQASRAGYCVCLSFCAVPGTITSQPRWVPLGSPIRQRAFWVGMGQHQQFCSSATVAGIPDNKVFACEKTPGVF